MIAADEYKDKVFVVDSQSVSIGAGVLAEFAIELARVGLDIPQIAHIAELLKNKGIDLKGELYTVEGVKKAILKLRDAMKKNT